MDSQTFKWHEYLSWKRKVNEARASAEALKSSLAELSQEKPPQSKWKTFFQRSPLKDTEPVKNNIYDRGYIRNVSEIIFPLSSRQLFKQYKSKSG